MLKPITQAILVAAALLSFLLMVHAACGQHPASCQVMKPAGRGWSIGSAGLVGHQLVVTNHHVAGSSGRVKVCWPTGRQVLGTVIGADRTYDISVVKLDKKVTDLPIFGVREAYPNVGSIGYQDGAPKGAKWHTRRIKITSLGKRPRFGVDVKPLVEWAPRSISGDSGGPVYGPHGNIYALCAMSNFRTSSTGPSGYSVCQLFRRLFGNGCIQGRQFRPP